ncbi:MAG: hypothetical protein ACOX88_01440 [Christensenellales bacterium]
MTCFKEHQRFCILFPGNGDTVDIFSVISGMGTPCADVEVVIDGCIRLCTKVDACGKWRIPAPLMDEGVHFICATENACGCRREAGAAFCLRPPISCCCHR